MEKHYKKILIIFITVISFVFIYKDLYLSHNLKIAMSADKSSSIQIFYDIGNGFNEVDSKIVEPTIQDGYSLYSFKLPNKNINNLRIDPSSEISNFEIKFLKIDNKIINKTYFPSDLKKSILSTNQITIHSDLTGYSTGNDPQIVFNNFISNDFKIPLWIKTIFLTIIFIFSYIILLLSRTNRFKSIQTKINQYIIRIDNTKFITSLELKNRFDIYVYISITSIIVLSGAYTVPISPLSFIYGLTLTVAAFLLSCLAWMLLAFLPKHNLTNILQKPFHSLFVGQLLLFIYIYMRSAFNEYIYYLPLSFVEFMAIFIIFIILTRKRFGKDALFAFLYENRKMLILSYGLFLLVMIGVSENELPRIFMLSTDPDQHAFFGEQIERFGTIPYQQFFWGSESFNYPSGTGVLEYLWASLTFLDIRNATHVQPLLQAVIAIFLVTEILNSKKFDSKKFLFISFGLLLTFTYFLRYTLEPSHFHFEGIGRLMSISLSAFVISVLIFSFVNRHNKNTISSSIVLIIFIAIIMFYSAALNPINVFYASALLGISFLVYLIKNIKFYLLTPLIFLIFFILLILDPYYLNVLIYKSPNNIADTLHYQPFDLRLDELIKLLWIELKNRVVSPSNFFNMDWLSGQFISLYILLSLSLISIVSIYKKKEREDNIFYLIVFSALVVFLLWIPISAFLYILSISATDYRLMDPYFSFNVMQYLYIFILLFLAFVILKLQKYINNYKEVIIIGISFMLILFLLDREVGNTHHTKRIDYVNTLLEDDKIVINEIEKSYKVFLKNKSQTDNIPKILIINVMPIMGDEKWLFPVGSGRILPFYKTFPLAFYYFKGENYFTYENYDKYICKSFDTDWLKSKNIQYLFIPSDNTGCIYNQKSILLNKEILVKHGNSYFIKLYN